MRVDMFPGALAELHDAEFRITLRAEQELRVVIRLEEGRVKGYLVESRDLCLLGPDEIVKVACDRILEVSVAKEMFLLGIAEIDFAGSGAVGGRAAGGSAAGRGDDGDSDGGGVVWVGGGVGEV